MSGRISIQFSVSCQPTNMISCLVSIIQRAEGQRGCCPSPSFTFSQDRAAGSRSHVPPEDHRTPPGSPALLCSNLHQLGGIQQIQSAPSHLQASSHTRQTTTDNSKECYSCCSFTENRNPNKQVHKCVGSVSCLVRIILMHRMKEHTVQN